MKIEIKSEEEQIDFKNGCIQLTPTSNLEAFKLGRIFAQLVDEGFEVTKSISTFPFIRIPLRQKGYNE